MAGGGPSEIEVIAVRKDPAIALLCGRSERSGAAPGLDGDVFRQTRIQNFVPANHALAMLLNDGLEPLVEIGLQRLVALDAVRAHELLNLLVRVPLLAVHLVASNMKKLIGKKSSHLSDELVKEFVGLLACGIHGGIENAPAAFDLVRPRAARQFGVADKPRRTVARHIELRHHADAAVACVGNQIADFFLRVIQAVRA